MIVSQRFGFVFFHIPKCAGSFIRQRLISFDESGSLFESIDRQQPFQNTWHHAHIPLGVLKSYFPKEFEQLLSLRSFATVRDPFKRFPSSVSQRLKEFKGRPIHTLSKNEVAREVFDTIRYLESKGSDLEYDYVHFTPQDLYVNLNGERVVNSLYTVSNTNEMLEEIEGCIGKTLSDQVDGKPVNQTKTYRFELLRMLFEGLRPALSGKALELLPATLKTQARSLLYTPKPNRNIELFESDDVVAFIKSYYAKDIEIFEKATASP